jgi:peptidylamidoglycolate lyase
VPFSAGLLSYASWFSIPPRKQHFLVQNSCCYRGFQPLTTFAVRVHTHTMGRAVFMTKMPTDPKGEPSSSSDSSSSQPVLLQANHPSERAACCMLHSVLSR